MQRKTIQIYFKDIKINNKYIEIEIKFTNYTFKF